MVFREKFFSMAISERDKGELTSLPLTDPMTKGSHVEWIGREEMRR